LVSYLGRRFNGEPGLPYAARTGQSDETHILSEQHLPNPVQLSATTEEMGGLPS
jgi:hypothetical protein